MKHPLLTLLISTLLPCYAHAQFEVTAPQSFAAPLLANPAMTGLFNGDIRVGTQYYNAYKHGGPVDYDMLNAAADMHVAGKALPAGDALGIGLFYQHEGLAYTVGQREFLHRKYGLSVAYHKHIGRAGNHTISVGLQAGNQHNYWWDWSAIVYTARTKTMRTGANMGITYCGRLSRKVSVIAGYSDIGLINTTGTYNTEPTYGRARSHNIMAGGSWQKSNYTSWHLNAFYTGHNREIQSNFYGRFVVDRRHKATGSEVALHGGFSWCMEGILAPYAAIEVGAFRLGMNVNTTVGSNVSAYYLGGATASLTYTGGHRKSRSENDRRAWQYPVVF